MCFNSSQTNELSRKLELQQMRCLAVILGSQYKSYSHALSLTCLPWLVTLRLETFTKWALKAHKDYTETYFRWTQEQWTLGFGTCSLFSDISVIRHSLRLNAEVVARAWQILGSLVVGIQIILHVVILFSCFYVKETYKINGKNFQNQSSCDSALGTALTYWRSDMCDFLTDFWRLSWSSKSTVYQIGELLVSKIINLWYIKHQIC